MAERRKPKPPETVDVRDGPGLPGAIVLVLGAVFWGLLLGEILRGCHG